MAENRPVSAGTEKERSRKPGGRPFEKGRSGNPGGRPKVEGEIRALAQEHGPAALKRLVQLMTSENERVSVIAAQAILDRAYGKPSQSLELDNKGNGPTAPLVIQFVKTSELPTARVS